MRLVIYSYEKWYTLRNSIGGKNMKIKILGSGCKNCQKLTDNTKEALKELGIEAEIEKVTDFIEIASFGVMSTPALVADEKVLSSGKVLKTKEIVNLLDELR